MTAQSECGPQVENGYTRIANEIIEALCRYRLSGEEMQCLFGVLRKTYGFGKKEDAISLSQFTAMTSLKRPHVVRALGKLVSKKVLSVTKKGTTSVCIYSFNKHFIEWMAVTKKDTTPRPASTNKDNDLLPIKVHTKETFTKESICASSKPKRAPRPPSGDQQLFLAWWSYAYAQVMNKPYMISGKDAKAAADLLKVHSLKPLVVMGSYFLSCSDEWLSSKRDLTMFRGMINRIPGHKDPAHDAETYRTAGIIPPDGVMFEDWHFWKLEAAQEAE